MSYSPVLQAEGRDVSNLGPSANQDRFMGAYSALLVDWFPGSRGYHHRESCPCTNGKIQKPDGTPRVITPTSNPFSSSSSNFPSYGPRLCGRWSWINSRIVSRGVCLLDSGLKLIINLRVFLFRELNPVVVIRKPLFRLFTILSTPHSQRERSVPRISPCLHRRLTLLPWRGSIYNSIFNVIR